MTGAIDSGLVLFLTKLLPVFVYPLGLGLALIILGGLCAWLGRRRIATVLITLSVAGLWVASTPAFSEWVLGAIERTYPPQPISELPAADVAIVLGGAVARPLPPRVTSDLMSTGDRVLHAARLFRAGKVRRILVTGGNVPWDPGQTPEASLMRALLIEWGVPAAAIATAGQSRNTYENALEIRDMRAQFPFSSALLVTSASHMPRAMAVFRRAGLPVTAATTDVEVVAGVPWTPLRWLPSADGLVLTTRALKEHIGTLAYRARGYL